MNSFQMTTKVNGMVTLTVTLTLKIANLDIVVVGGIRASQAHPFHLSNALYRFWPDFKAIPAYCAVKLLLFILCNFHPMKNIARLLMILLGPI